MVPGWTHGSTGASHLKADLDLSRLVTPFARSRKVCCGEKLERADDAGVCQCLPDLHTSFSQLIVLALTPTSLDFAQHGGLPLPLQLVVCPSLEAD
jgi:hypothetical protein